MADVEKKTISLKDHLAQQDALIAVFRATLEAASETTVMVTPWSKEAGCLCDYSFVVDASAIRELVRTAETYSCCGKQLTVVEVTFVDAYKAVAQVVAQQVAVRRKPLRSGAPCSWCGEVYEECLADCRPGDTTCRSTCASNFRSCIRYCNQ